MNSPFDEPPLRQRSRTRPPSVPPVLHQGVRYEQLAIASAEGLPLGGYLVATDVASGARLWCSQVYATVLDPQREADVQMVFFRSLTLDAAQGVMRVEDERRRTYQVRLSDGQVL